MATQDVLLSDTSGLPLPLFSDRRLDFAKAQFKHQLTIELKKIDILIEFVGIYPLNDERWYFTTKDPPQKFL
ncbi:MAG: hypothetical protein QMC77_09010 [Methanocellales archaeon]|nr:hypothetical protein [Methanocellales archaeon]